MNRGRRRFTIAHELGHAVIEGLGSGRPRHGRELETICNMIAAELLLPRKVVQPFLVKPNLVALFRLAQVFDVSLRTAAIRCKELCGLHSFEVGHDGRLAFTTGLVRIVDESLAEIVSKVRETPSLEADVFLRVKELSLRYGTSRGSGREEATEHSSRFGRSDAL